MTGYEEPPEQAAARRARQRERRRIGLPDPEDYAHPDSDVRIGP